VLVIGGVLATLFVCAALVLGWEQLVPWALGVLGTEYAISLFIRGGGSEDAAPLYGAGLLLLGELVAWSLALRTRMREEPPVLLLRLGTIVAAVAGSAALGTILLGLAASDAGGGLAWTTVGTAAAIAAVALVVRAVRA
jgi:hypothetical protein